MEATALDSVAPAGEACPDPFESALRLRMQAKIAMAKSLVEERIARCNRTRQQQPPPGQRLQPGEPVNIYRVPERKEQSGWRGPAELVKLSQGTGIVVWNGIPYILPTRHIRRHTVNVEKLKLGEGQTEDLRGQCCPRESYEPDRRHSIWTVHQTGEGLQQFWSHLQASCASTTSTSTLEYVSSNLSEGLPPQEHRRHRIRNLSTQDTSLGSDVSRSSGGMVTITTQ
eukprot:4257325-Pyramimonas_sp.AAC.1